MLNVVEDYIESASPVTSSNVREKNFTSLSTATLRNELNALEAMGYLKQLHTSSGRVPTDKGYRYFANAIMAEVPMDKTILDEIHQIFINRTGYLGDVVNEIADTLSKLTNYPTVVKLNGLDKLIVKTVKIVPLLTGQALLLVETPSGVIHNFMNSKPDVPPQTFVDASNFLTRTFSGQSLMDMVKNIDSYKVSMANQISEFADIFDRIIESLKGLSDKVVENNGFSAKGELKLLNNPEYRDVDKAKRVIDAINNPEELAQIFEGEQSQDVTFKIGKEIPVKDLQECAIVSADYIVDGKSVASIGIIGPQRMDYARIAGALKFVAGEFANLKLIDTTAKGDDNIDEK